MRERENGREQTKKKKKKETDKKKKIDPTKFRSMRMAQERLGHGTALLTCAVTVGRAGVVVRVVDRRCRGWTEIGCPA